MSGDRGVWYNLDMTEKIKNILGVSIIVALIAVAYGVISYAGSFSRQIDFSAPRLTVSGEAKVVAIPDVATFSFGVVTEGGEDVAILQKENAKKANSIIKFIKSSGVDDKDIKTANYSIQPRYQYYKCGPSALPKADAEPCPPREIAGYTIRQTVEVKIRDFKKAGDILSGVGERGANSVSRLSFSVDNKIKFENEARAKAIKRAKEKASAIADVSGFRLGRLLSVNESRVNYYSARQYSIPRVSDAQSQDTSVNIEPGSQDITSNVTLQYQIK